MKSQNVKEVVFPLIILLIPQVIFFIFGFALAISNLDYTHYYSGAPSSLPEFQDMKTALLSLIFLFFGNLVGIMTTVFSILTLKNKKKRRNKNGSKGYLV